MAVPVKGILRSGLGLLCGMLLAQPSAPRTEKKVALVIGNDAYLYVTPLKTATNDARSVQAVLQGRYGFETTLLLNATRSQIVSALNAYRRDLGPDSSLLIYYAGHGYYDEKMGKAYWWPVDAQDNDNTNWIGAEVITSNIKVTASRHVLIVSDSCYSGTLRGVSVPQNLNGLNTDRARTLLRLEQRPSRELMASGGNEPVADGGAGGHSVFAGAFLSALERMPAAQFAAHELFDEVRTFVAGNSAQLPEFDPLRDSGDNGGSFVFSRAAGAAPVTGPAPGPTRTDAATPTPAPPSAAKSDDAGVARAREELRSQGLGMDIAGAKNALLSADNATLRLLTAAATRPAVFEEALRQKAGDGDASVARRFFEATLNAPDAIAWLDDELTKGLNPNLTLAGSYYPKEGLLLEAMRASNAAALKTLLKHGASPHAYQDLFLTSYADTRFLFPLRFIANDDHMTLAEKQDLIKAFLEAGAVVPQPIAPKGGMGWPSVMYEAKNLQDEAAPKLGMKLAPTPTLCEQPARAICRSASERTKEDWCSLVAAVPKKLNFVYGKSSPLYDVTLPYLLGIDQNRMYFLGLQVNSVDTDYLLVEVSKDGNSWTVLRFMSPASAMGLCRKDPDGFQPKDCWRRVTLHRVPGTDEMHFDDWGLAWKISADACAPAR